MVCIKLINQLGSCEICRVITMAKKLMVSPTIKSPTPICNGNPTIKTFICGTVRATRPNPTLIKNKIAMMGAAILTATTNVVANSFRINAMVPAENPNCCGLIS